MYFLYCITLACNALILDYHSRSCDTTPRAMESGIGGTKRSVDDWNVIVGNTSYDPTQDIPGECQRNNNQME